MSVNFLVPLRPQPNLTAATSPAKGNYQPYDCTGGNLAPPLPALSTVSDNAQLLIEKSEADTSTHTLTVTCAGSDTFATGGTTLVLKVPGEKVHLQAATIAAVRHWKVLDHSAPVSSLDARYDASGAATSAIAAAAGAASGLAQLDSTAKLPEGQIPNLSGLPYGAASGSWQNPTSLLTVAAAAAMTSGKLYLLPFDVAPGSDTFNALGLNVGTAQVAGTTVTTLGVYSDDGSGGRPNLAAGPIASGAAVLTAIGAASATVSWAPNSGRYWLAALYVASVAPSTAALVTQVGTAVPLSQATLGQTLFAWTATGLSALPTTAIALTLSSTAIPLIAAKAA